MSQSTQASQWKHHQLIVSQIPVTNKRTGPIGMDRKRRGGLSAAASQNTFDLACIQLLLQLSFAFSSWLF